MILVSIRTASVFTYLDGFIYLAAIIDELKSHCLNSSKSSPAHLFAWISITAICLLDHQSLFLCFNLQPRCLASPCVFTKLVAKLGRDSYCFYSTILWASSNLYSHIPLFFGNAESLHSCTWWNVLMQIVLMIAT